jgi:hypothetical protein
LCRSFKSSLLLSILLLPNRGCFLRCDIGFQRISTFSLRPKATRLSRYDVWISFERSPSSAEHSATNVIFYVSFYVYCGCNGLCCSSWFHSLAFLAHFTCRNDNRISYQFHGEKPFEEVGRKVCQSIGFRFRDELETFSWHHTMVRDSLQKSLTFDTSTDLRWNSLADTQFYAELRFKTKSTITASLTRMGLVRQLNKPIIKSVL